MDLKHDVYTITNIMILRIVIILFLKLMYFPEKGCHLGTNRSDNET